MPCSHLKCMHIYAHIVIYLPVFNKFTRGCYLRETKEGQKAAGRDKVD